MMGVSEQEAQVWMKRQPTSKVTAGKIEEHSLNLAPQAALNDISTQGSPALSLQRRASNGSQITPNIDRRPG